MNDDIREERCAEVADALLELMPAILEGKSDPARLQDALAAARRIRRVADAGSAGISDPAFRAWIDAAPGNLTRLESALIAGEADAAFTAFRDPADGLHLLTTGCAGCRGW